MPLLPLLYLGVLFAAKYLNSDVKLALWNPLNSSKRYKNNPL